MNTSRPKKVTFRLSESEFAQLQELIKTSELSSQEFLLRSVLDKPIFTKSVYQELLIEIKRQGVNLNQIAKSCNRGAYDIAKLNSALQEIEKVWQSLKL